MHRLGLLVILSGLASPAEAQQVPTPHNTDIESGVLHLGGDSAQIATLSLRPSQPYRLEIRPAGAEIRVRRRTIPPAQPLPLEIRSSSDSARIIGFKTLLGGEHIFELTNPGRPATVRVVQEGGVAPLNDAAVEAMLEPEARVFDEFFPGPRATVVLAADVAYRLELRGSGPDLPPSSITIHSVRSASGPPLVLTPMSNPTLVGGGETFLLVPTATDEYRIDVGTNDAMEVRIVRDPKETQRWARMRQETQHLPAAGLTMRVVGVGPFPAPVESFDPANKRLGGVGADLCLGSVPRGAWFSGSAWGGCAFSLTWYSRSNNASTLFVSIAPRYEITRPSATTRISAGISFGIGTTTEGKISQSYWLLGLSVIGNHPISRRFASEWEAGFLLINAMDAVSDSSSAAGHTALPYHFALGLQYHL